MKQWLWLTDMDKNEIHDSWCIPPKPNLISIHQVVTETKHAGAGRGDLILCRVYGMSAKSTKTDLEFGKLGSKRSGNLNSFMHM
jgi:hypothetical protein